MSDAQQQPTDYTIYGKAVNEGSKNVIVRDPVAFRQLCPVQWGTLSKYTSVIKRDESDDKSKDLRIFDLSVVNNLDKQKPGVERKKFGCRIEIPEVITPFMTFDAELGVIKILFSNPMVRKYCEDLNEMVMLWAPSILSKREDPNILPAWKGLGSDYLVLKWVKNKRVSFEQFIADFNPQLHTVAIELGQGSGWLTSSDVGVKLKISTFAGMTERGLEIAAAAKRASAKKRKVTKVDDEGNEIAEAESEPAQDDASPDRELC